jgi:hypothetical protein
MAVHLDAPVAVPADRRAHLEAFKETRRRAVAWILSHQNRDGSLGDARDGYHFYRAAWTLGLVGETEAASAVCGWFRRNMLTADGRIDGPFRVFNDAWAYRDSALIVGAQALGQYDLSLGLMPEMLRWQDPRSGGFANDRLPNGEMGDDQSIPYAAGPGFAALAVGDLAAARRVADFLRTIYDAQPDLPNRFFYDWSRRGQAPTTKFADEDRFWYVVENQADRNQRWTIGGIAAAFLSRLYLAEPRPELLDLARRYQAFSMAATPANSSTARFARAVGDPHCSTRSRVSPSTRRGPTGWVIGSSSTRARMGSGPSWARLRNMAAPRRSGT